MDRKPQLRARKTRPYSPNSALTSEETTDSAFMQWLSFHNFNKGVKFYFNLWAYLVKVDIKIKRIAPVNIETNLIKGCLAVKKVPITGGLNRYSSFSFFSHY